MPTETKTATKKKNPLLELGGHGQAVWLDNIRRSLIDSGELRRLIEEDGLTGVTSNPAIFEKAIAGSSDYISALAALQKRGGLDAAAIYETLAFKDIQDAADVLRPVYDRTNGRDGFVSLEVSPYFARDTRRTMEEALRLWKALGRENVMIKVPATNEGVDAIAPLIEEGVNLNVTLIFSVEAYDRVASAYLDGLERRAARKLPLERIASVASVFVSRVDAAVDALIDARLKTEADSPRVEALRGLKGRAAVANAKLAYARFGEITAGKRWKALAANGAQVQRLLWASTGSKNPAYRDVVYVEELIGPDTVNTVPPATLDAFRDHGRVRLSLNDDLAGARGILDALAGTGISLRAVTDRLLEDGLAQFVDAFDKLLNAADLRCRLPRPGRAERLEYSLPQGSRKAADALLNDWRMGGMTRRLWSRDASLWTGRDEAAWLGWLDLPERQREAIDDLWSIQEAVRAGGYEHALLLGMGGSSLCPEVLRRTFGRIPEFPELLVLDSTDPAQVRAFAARTDPARTLYIVSSKSGSTLEPNLFKEYFFDRAVAALGYKEARLHFMAITDPGSALDRLAQEEGFFAVRYGLKSVGGRYSALSDFGLVPAAIMGLDVARLLDRAHEMSTACSSCVPVDQNPGVVLGVLLGGLAREGRDKITFVASPGIGSFGSWLEQLLAESTGKEGKGLVPVDGEAPGAPETYARDRVFVYLRLASAPDAAQDAAMAALERDEQPVIRITLDDEYDLGREFFRWEFAAAAAGAVLGINPFDQPDVEASKTATLRLMTDYEKTGVWPEEAPLLEEDGVGVFADERNADTLGAVAGLDRSLAGFLRAHLGRLGEGDYLGLLAYLEMIPEHEKPLAAIRAALRERSRAATCVGFGPRFLHSTGQLYKGGPGSGVFIQVTRDDPSDLAIPGRKYTFGRVKAAQARGDLAVLSDRGRRVLRVHLGTDAERGLEVLRAAVLKALA